MTQVLPGDGNAIAEAARLLQAGQVVGMPTETVYGLAANALDEDAVRRIFEAKGRPQDNPLIVHIGGMEMLPMVAREISCEAQALAQAFWPGPLTLVLPKAGAIPAVVSAGLDTVGVRMPAHPVALALIAQAGVPLAAPSANRSGGPSPTQVAHVQKDLDGRIPLVVDGGRCPVGVESTVLALGEKPLVLRPGFVTAGEIAQVLGRPVEVAGQKAAFSDGQTPQSPGMKYQHYAPKAQLTLLEGGFEKYAEYVAEKAGKIAGVYALCFDGEAEKLAAPAVCYGRAGDAASQAAGLYAALRTLDERGAQAAFARVDEKTGVGQAVYNRLLRAANFRVIYL
ncbi:MAG: L-threonylcarbamoyladenylate synthase [Oscillospiraceae bacterium]